MHATKTLAIAIGVAVGLLVAWTAHAQSNGPLAQTVVVLRDGTIFPEAAVASIHDLAKTAAAALAFEQAALAAAEVSMVVSQNIAVVEGVVAASRAHAIFRGFVTSFSAAVEPVTNATAQILQFATRSVGTNVYADIDTWFSTAPAEPPALEYRTRLSTGDWGWLDVISNSWPATVDVATPGGVYQCYRSTAVIPAAQTSAFFRVNGVIDWVYGDEEVLPIYGGLRVNGQLGLTTNIVVGGVTNRFVGGVLVGD